MDISRTVPLLISVILPSISAVADTLSRPGVLEEVVVTARKKAEPITEVPTSITVLDKSFLEATGSKRLQDVALRLPNFATNQSPLTPFAQQYVRGMNAFARNIGFDSGFGVFVDGVYSGRYATHNRAIGNVERVEYLPGPQGTLFGKNTTLGVLNVVTAAPDRDFGASFELGAGNLGARQMGGTVSAPIGENWSFGLNADTRSRDGIVENTFTDQQGNNVDEWSTSARLDGEIGATRITLSADVFESTPDLIARQRVKGFGALPPRQASHDFDGDQEEKDFGASLRLSHPIGNATFTSITGFRGFETVANVDDDAFEQPVQHLLDWSEEQDQWSQEFRFAGSVERFSYLAGVYYQQQDISSFRGVQSGPAFATVDGALESRSLAAFGTVTYDFSPALSAELGLRWSREDKDLPTYEQSGGGVLIDFSTNDDRSASTLTPTASMTWRVSERSNVYARYARGFKSGGFNVDIVTAPEITPLEFDDEVVDSVEVGVKSTLLDQRMMVGLSAYYSKYEDLQVSQFQIIDGALLPTLRVTNAASATSRGFEANVDLLLERWTLVAGLGFADAEIDDFSDPLGPGTGNWAGNGLGGPRWTANLLGRYERPVAQLADLMLMAEYLFQDRIGGDLTDDPRAISDPLSLVNLRGELRFGPARSWRVAAWVANVFDTTKVVELQQNPAAGLLAFVGFPPEVIDSSTGLYNAPRTFGVDVGFAF